MLQFGTKNSRRAWHVIPEQEVEEFTISSDFSLGAGHGSHTLPIVSLLVIEFPS
ncbi:hypothetical protein WN51_03159 [Melipona quadrifasciata]|uniref:Uncharacterized protein n=1 Tax=Melipona quadrifasciata TaxID=166423 RepID=A0A0N0BEK5_9HYME|nr:hypothetical protein WN51_03159 [Melipona quadrifasciata]